MSPLLLLLYCLSPVPAIVIVALVINLAANNIIETRATAMHWPQGRRGRSAKARR